uniref:Protein FRA10AC1 homolog n=1 Tax=Cacopsylla melanoneura TaxID=428564 RepID=A0A8D8ZQG0_9HEMI
MNPGVRNHLLTLAPYELHKKLINNYVLTQQGSTSRLKRDSSRDKTDLDVIIENHKFLWDESSEPSTWEEELAKKYYDKLFKEYCICDLSRYKHNQVAMRWQTESELCKGKGQFICGEKRCEEENKLRTWEVNFGYVEQGEKKNALVKLRLCPEHSSKLNYKHKRKEVKRQQKNRKKKHKTKSLETTESKEEEETKNEDEMNVEEGDESKDKTEEEEERNVWKGSVQDEEKTRDDDFDEYLDQLFM